MYETRGFKIFICLILTVITMVLWVYLWNHWTSNVGQTTYKDAVFVENEYSAPKEGDDSLWSI